MHFLYMLRPQGGNSLFKEIVRTKFPKVHAGRRTIALMFLKDVSDSLWQISFDIETKLIYEGYVSGELSWDFANFDMNVLKQKVHWEYMYLQCLYIHVPIKSLLGY